MFLYISQLPVSIKTKARDRLTDENSSPPTTRSLARLSDGATSGEKLFLPVLSFTPFTCEKKESKEKGKERFRGKERKARRKERKGLGERKGKERFSSFSSCCL